MSWEVDQLRTQVALGERGFCSRATVGSGLDLLGDS